MTNTTCLNRCLLLAVLRAPAPLISNMYRNQTAIGWVRTITSTSLRAQPVPLISFGAENDAIVAQYMQGASKKTKSKKVDNRSNTNSRKGTGSKTAAAQVLEASSTTDDYEIGDIIDRSSPARQEGQLPIHGSEAGTGKSASPPKQKGAWQLKTERSLGRRQSREEQNLGKKQLPDMSQPRPRLDKWAEQKNALREKFSEGWNPRKKLSPDAMEGVRGLHEQDPVKYSTPVLAEQFRVSPEAIRRILKSKWSSRAGSEKMDERRERWAKRHDRIWDAQAELGLRPQRQKEKDVEDPDKFEKDMVRKEILGEM